MKPCQRCYEKGFTFTKYSERYDAYYCGICGEWIEPQCKDPKCSYCVNRPKKGKVS